MNGPSRPHDEAEEVDGTGGELNETARELRRADFDCIFDRMKQELGQQTSLALLKKHFDIAEEISSQESVLLELRRRRQFWPESVEAVRAVLVRHYESAPWFQQLRAYQLKWIPEEHPFEPDVVRVVCDGPGSGRRWPVSLEFLELSHGGVEERVLHQKKFQGEVVDPFKAHPGNDKRLEWYFEDFLKFPFVDKVKAREAAESVRAYGAALFESLFGGADSDLRQILCAAVEARTLKRIEVIGPADFQGLHWEALRDPLGAAELGEPLATRVPIVRRPKRREEPLGEFQLQFSKSATLNVLLVVARPGGRDDVAYRTLARPLFEECAAQAELPVRIDLLRPPTFSNLDRFLTDQGARGVRYHIAHLDMHGAVLTWEQTVAGVFTNRFAFKKPATKGQDGTSIICERFEGRRPLVFFEADGEEVRRIRLRAGGADGESRDVQAVAEAVDAERLGEVLQSHGVPVALIDACQSSKQEVDSSMASQLLQKGVRIVVGMAYTVTVDAACALMREVYARMLGSERSAVHDTICLGRKKLLEKKQRRVFYNQMIELEDWILPQVYGDADFQLEVQEETPAQRKERERRSTWEYQPEHAPWYGFVGRDLDVLEIERRILCGATNNVVLVRGMGGVGKTTLLEHICGWWQQTHLVERVFYFGYDAKAWTRQQILRAIGAKVLAADDFKTVFVPADEDEQQALVSNALRATRHVVVLDNLESVTLPYLAVPNTLDAAEQHQVRRFVKALVGGQTLVVLGSRGEEEWLRRGTFEMNVHELRGLDDEAATSFASRVLEASNVDPAVLQDPDMEHILRLLDGFPLPMAVILGELSRQERTAAELRKALESGGGVLQQGLELAEDGSGRMAGKTENIIACVEYSFCNLPHSEQRMLECLAPFTGVFDTKLIDEYTGHLRAQAVFLDVPFEQFPAALEQLKRRGLAGDAAGGFLQLHPVFPYFLRSRLVEAGREQERRAIDVAFHRHYEEVASVVLGLLESKEAGERALGLSIAGIESENFVSAALIGGGLGTSVLSCLQTVNAYWDSVLHWRRTLELARRVFAVGGGVDAVQEGGDFGYCLLQCLLTQGVTLLKLQDAENARPVLQQLIELAQCMSDVQRGVRLSVCAVAHHNLGFVAQEQRKWQQAEEHYRKELAIYIETDDKYEQAGTYHELGNVAEGQRQWQQAEELYHKALAISVESNDLHSQAGAYHQLGMVAQGQRKWQQAEEHYRKALAIEIEFNDLHSLARTYQQLGRVAQELRKWQQAEEHYRKALAIDVKSNDLHSQASAYHQLGRVAEEQRQWQQAEEYYSEALAIEVEFNDQHWQASTYQQLGRVAQEQRKWQHAEKYYRKALALEVESNDLHSQASTYHQLGVLAQLQRQWQQAEEHYRKALAFDVQSNDLHSLASTYHQLGAVAQEQRQWQQAEEHYHRALEIYVNTGDKYEQADTYHQLGMVAEEQRRWQRADDHYRKALAIEVEFSDRYSQASTIHQLGRVAEKQREWQQAEEHFLQAEAIYREHSDAHYRGIVLDSLRRLCWRSGDAELAARVAAAVPEWAGDVRRVLPDVGGGSARSDGGGVGKVDAAGKVLELAELAELASSGDERALAALDEIIAGDEGNVEAVKLRGAVRFRHDDMAGAAADFDRVLSADPSNIGALVARESARAATGNLAGALLDVQRAAELDPSSEALQVLTSALSSFGLSGDSCSDTQAAPEDRARVLSESGQLYDAIAAMDEAIAERPEIATLYFQRAALLRASSDPLRAEADDNAFLTLWGRPFGPEIEACLAAGQCTFAATQRKFVEQFWYECKTCGLVADEGCCEVCAERCHRGHDVKIFPRMSSFYCDCGARGQPACCAVMREQPAQPQDG